MKKIFYLSIVSIIFILLLGIESLAATKIDNKYVSAEFPDDFKKENGLDLDIPFYEGYYKNVNGNLLTASVAVYDGTEENYYTNAYLEESKKEIKDMGVDLYTIELAELGGAKGVTATYGTEGISYRTYMLQTNNYIYSVSFSASNKKDLNGEIANNFFKSFIAKEGETETEQSASEPSKPVAKIVCGFNDVTENDWFATAVKYAYENNLIKGYNDTTFAPNDNLTRGMLVTILYRFEGAKANDGKSKFADVDSKQWYAQPIKWASENGVVAGYNDKTFGPEDNITREQLAVILYRYATYKEKNMDKTNDLKKFSDTGSISDYAVKAMKWAVGAGVITGNADGTLNPKGNATRAETAAMMTKYCKNVGK